MVKEIERTFLLLNGPYQHFGSKTLDLTSCGDGDKYDFRFKEHIIRSNIHTIYVTPRTRARKIVNDVMYSIYSKTLFENDSSINKRSYNNDHIFFYKRSCGSPACILGSPQYYRTTKSGEGMIREENDRLLSYDEFNMEQMEKSGEYNFTKKHRLSFKGKCNKKFGLDWKKLGINDLIVDKYLLCNKVIGAANGLGIKLNNTFNEKIPYSFSRCCSGVQGPIKLEIEFKDIESAENFNYKDHIILKNKVLCEITNDSHYRDYEISKWNKEDFIEHINKTSVLAEQLLNVKFSQCQ